MPNPGIGHNGISAEAKPYLDRIENLLGEIRRLKDACKEDCKPAQEDIKEIYEEAKANGISVKALRGLVKHRELTRKQQQLSAKLTMDEAAMLTELVDALGEFADTPLGEAAKARVSRQADAAH
jgi:uncharacterized protein (UPF0335 family)